MKLEVGVPGYPLNQFVDCFFYHEETNPAHSIDRFLPDGNTEIIIDLTETPKYIYDNETLVEKQACKNAWASGVRSEYITIPSGIGSAMLVIYFKKGMAYPFFPFPLDEMSDRVVDTDLIWGREFTRLRELLLAEKNIDRRFEITECFLTDRYHTQMEINPCVDFATKRIVEQPNHLVLGTLYEQIGYSQKHFTEMFKTHVGVTPKAYLRIMRFQKAINEIETGEDLNWVSIAHEAGFYDQAHFINDFKRFSGFTPEGYLKRKNGNLNYVPVG